MEDKELRKAVKKEVKDLKKQLKGKETKGWAKKVPRFPKYRGFKQATISLRSIDI